MEFMSAREAADKWGISQRRDMIIYNCNQIRELISGIKKNIELTSHELSSVLQKNPIESLARLKFDKIAMDPLNGEKINFIEMLNQAYSDLVVLYAAEELIKQYPGKSFELSMGALNGFDISSTDGMVIAECFAVVSVFNNQKMEKDSQKLMQETDLVDKYIFYYSREDTDSAVKRITEKYSEIHYKRIEQF